MGKNARTLKLGCPALESIGPNKWDRCRDNASLLDLINGVAEDVGVVPTADMAMAANPADTDDFTLVLNPGPGAVTENYEFLDAPTGAAFEIQRGANAAASLLNAVAVINAQTALPIIASVNGTNLRIQYAEYSAAALGDVDITLAEAMTAGASVWTQANLGNAGQTNKLFRSSGSITVDATNLATTFTLPLSFVPQGVFFMFRDAAGLPKPTCSAVVTFSAAGLIFNFGNGGDPAVATDVVFFESYGSVEA